MNKEWEMDIGLRFNVEGLNPKKKGENRRSPLECECDFLIIFSSG